MSQKWWTLGPRAGLSLAKEARGEAVTARNKERQSGRWGVAQACKCGPLLEAQHPDLAIVLIEQELNPQY
jgi:hypothetical protein